MSAFGARSQSNEAKQAGGATPDPIGNVRQYKGKIMYLIAAFGLLMMSLSLAMVAKPDAFSNGIITFSEKSYFHLFEIISRIAAGIIFIAYAENTLFPITISFIGYGLILVGLGLALTPPKLHKKFAVWSANKFRSKFRLIGIASVPLSMFLIYSAVGTANA
ncbi:hypothetical protein ABGI61_12000 [Rheinheimera sp. FR7-31]|uniref:hypothetical protein n=1 Tax=Rheinheimera fenheensis TaxID=3152295 RepID=UPI00325E72EA